jgi:hypothetical protein
VYSGSLGGGAVGQAVSPRSAAAACVVTDTTLLRNNVVLQVLARLSFIGYTATTFYWNVICGGEDTIFAVSVFGKRGKFFF